MPSNHQISDFTTDFLDLLAEEYGDFKPFDIERERPVDKQFEQREFDGRECSDGLEPTPTVAQINWDIPDFDLEEG